MPCASYTDPRLVAVYDTLNPPGPDHHFHVEVAGETRISILDMGCGTGRLSIALAAAGHRVTGADPAAAMLDVARRRQGGDAVQWVHSDAAGLVLDERFDLIAMTGNVFQVFLSDADAADALAALRRHLAPGGRLSFGTRNPLVRDWETWVPEETREILDVPGLGTVGVHYDIAGVQGELVAFETHFRFAENDRTVATSTLRFMGRERLETLLREAGFTELEWYGDFDRSAFAPDSPEIVVIAG